VTAPSADRTSRAPGIDPGRCLFCRIVAGEVAAHVVYEDDGFLAFLDHRPLFAGHALLVPREHVDTLFDAPGELLGPLAAATQRLSIAVRDAMEADGVFNAINNVVSQSVPHLHVHVVPRRRKDGLRGFFWPRTKYASDADAGSVATRILALTKPFEGS
jgi:histidine triad (HIT) family protein